ncbi:MAG: GGDEF domain-containing protein [Clostridia bacterium]|nr:GGDEF domain-containing protein [Clostridia bacterium]
MGINEFIFYSEANIICVIMLLMLLINDIFHSTKQEKQVWFSRAIVANILYFISDIGWAAVLAGQLPKTRTLVALFNLSNYILLSLMAYEWFMFMAASERMDFRKMKEKRILCFLPMIVSTLVMVIAYIAAPNFWIGEDCELNAWYYPMMISVPAFYLIASFVFSMINAGKAQSRDDQTLYRLIGIYPIGVMAFGILQVVTLSLPVFCFGCTIMLQFFYIQNMQALISVDALTRLNNRGQIDRYMDQVRYRENAPVFIMMIDIDRFKEINDNFGHGEGDRALIIVSESLKQICERFKAPVFLGRYGGDEFTIIIQNPGEDESPERTAEIIRDTLSQKRAEKQLPYDLEVSIGYEALRDRNDTMKECMRRADENLYADKRNRGAGR